MSDEVYDVASSKQNGTVYTVNIATVMCTCFAGSTGKCCKHVHYVLTEMQHLSQSVSYHFSDKRSLFYEVAIGSPAPSGWLDLLHGGLNQTMSASVEVPAPVDVPVPLEVPTPVEVPDPAEILDPAEEIAQHIATVDRLFKTKVHDVARENPDAFISAYKTFIDTLQSLSTANAAASALHTFGKYAGGGKRVGKRLSSITVQSTAIARRKKLLRGKHPGEAGRPRKSAVVVQNKHDYSLPSRKRNQPAPHALGECVSRNISLGSSHSKK